MRWAFAAPWVCVLASAQMSFNTDNVSTACWVFFWWRTATVRVIARMLWEMQVWRCGHDWIYFSAVLLACSLPGTSLITHTGPGSHAWVVHGLGMCTAKQATAHLQTVQFQLLLSTVWMLWIHLGDCQQRWKMCCLQDWLYMPEQLSNHLTDIVQSTKKLFW